MNSPDPEALARLVHRTLRALPDQRAPLALEHRVLAEIGRRAARPWWRQSFGHWPPPVRAAFVLASVAAAGGIAGGAMNFGPSFDTWPVAGRLLGGFAWVAPVGECVRALGGAGSALGRSIPAGWVYGAAAGIAALYAGLLALGAASYRLLSSVRSPA
jgi:hypothetical protein